jgi:DNA-binding MarR family transcriptional regulator
MNRMLTGNCHYDSILSMVASTPRGRLFNDILGEVFRLRARLLESAEDLAAQAGLTSARWQILGAVELAPAPVAHVARNLGLTRQTVQETADAMARDGLIEFHDNPDHKRARLMVPTPRARKALDYLRPRQTQFAGLMGGRHSLDDLQTTLDVLRKARTTLEVTERTTS